MFVDVLQSGACFCVVRALLLLGYSISWLVALLRSFGALLLRFYSVALLCFCELSVALFWLFFCSFVALFCSVGWSLAAL
jgi:hypothetical protein